MRDEIAGAWTATRPAARTKAEEVDHLKMLHLLPFVFFLPFPPLPPGAPP